MKLGFPDTMLDVFHLHSELIYHPAPKIVEQYYQHYVKKPYPEFKKYFDAMKSNYLLTKPKGFYESVID